VHRWVPWIAGYSWEFVADALTRHLPRGATVLDPFCGVGTTLVESLLHGHRAIGFEINPYAALASRAKTRAHEIDLERLGDETRRFCAYYASRTASRSAPTSSPPSGFRTRAAFYSPKVLRKVLLVQDFLPGVEDPGVQDLFRLAFGATMVRYSNYSYEPSLGRRVSAGREEVADFAVGEEIARKLQEIAADVRWLRKSLPKRCRDATVIGDSFFRYPAHVEAESVDLILTSPPYLNNYHYNRNTRPHLYWLGFVSSPRDLKTLEESNFGKYWQTVRELERVELDFSLPRSELPGRIGKLRGLHAGKGIYGGNGWANYVASYFNDCHRLACGMREVLRPGGVALVVIGNSIIQGLPIPTDRHLGEIAASVGLEAIDIHVPRATRVGNSIIQSNVRVAKAKNSQQLYEAVVELRKP
jgi:SAM-dependent methyltransferase